MAHRLNTTLMLQAYQAEKLWDLHKALAREENPAKLLDEAHRTVAITPRTGMAETVVAQRHLWLTFKELPEMQYTEFLHQAVEPAGLFGQALETIGTHT